MKKGLVISDSSPLISLAVIDRLDILTSLFNDIRIPNAVWNEITSDKTKRDYQKLFDFFKEKTCQISGFNDLRFLLDQGESESIILFKELNADFLLIEDKKARKIAEALNIKCVGLIGLLSVAHDKGLISSLKPVFVSLLRNNRYYATDILNVILISKGENVL